jgi:TRAP-type C4-dicarboxylate transport system substrate-binding protein
MVTKIKWMIAHEPADLFLRTANAFNAEIKDRTGGEYEVEAIVEKEMKGITKLVPAVRNGDVHMVQVLTHAVGLGVLNWPYLFRDHDHAARVLEGKIGRTLLQSLEGKDLKGMAFTYSGGFRMFVSEKPVNSLDDLKNLKISVHDNPVIVDSLMHMGLQPDAVPTTDWGVWDVDHYECEAAETTFVRYLKEFKEKKFIANTEHSLFLTTVVANLGWFNSLSDEIQKIFLDAAKEAARKERQWSLEDSTKVKEMADELGIRIYQPTDAELNEMRDGVKPLRHKYPHLSRTIREIEAA